MTYADITYKKSSDIKGGRNFLVIFVSDRGYSIQYKREKKKRYAYLVIENVGNFQMCTRDSIVVLTLWRGLLLPIRAQVSYDLQSENGIAVPRFVFNELKAEKGLVGKERIKMIADVIYKNKMYYVLDERGKEISHNWESSLGELMGFSGMFMVFLKNRMYYSYDDRCKEIAHDWESNLGEFRNVAGTSVNFRKNKMIYTRDRFFKEISHRWE